MRQNKTSESVAVLGKCSDSLETKRWSQHYRWMKIILRFIPASIPACNHPPPHVKGIKLQALNKPGRQIRVLHRRVERKKWIKIEQARGLVLVLLFLPFVLLRNASDGIHVGTVTDSAGGRSNRNGWITERGYEERERVRRGGRIPSLITHWVRRASGLGGSLLSWVSGRSKIISLKRRPESLKAANEDSHMLQRLEMITETEQTVRQRQYEAVF